MNHLSEQSFPIIGTGRLLLRELRPDDAGHVFALRSAPEYSALTGVPRYQTLEDAQDYIRRITNSVLRREVFFWVITDSRDGPYWGSVCLWNIDWGAKQAEIGYDLLAAYRGKGIVSEALRAVLAYAFDTLLFERIVTGDIHPENEKSAAVVRRAGFLQSAGSGSYCLTRQSFRPMG